MANNPFIFPTMQQKGCEQVVFFHDADSGLKAIVAIHSTLLGPSLGGCRFFNYPTEEAAFRDVTSLAEAMTHKAALAGLSLGGGKAVILGDPTKEKSEKLWTAYGKFIDRLGGTYITTEDSGTSPADMDIVGRSTKYVAGTSKRSGDPSPVTARGVLHGIEACAQFAYGSPDLKGKRVAIQGLGHVGWPLARSLREKGALLIVTDKSADVLRQASSELGAEVVGLADIFGVACDIFAPCALGGAINLETIPKLKCSIVAGAANNQLASTEAADELLKRGIVYAPDFAINAGGLINVAAEIFHMDAMFVETKTQGIFETITTILAQAKSEAISPATVALRLARERVRAKS